MFKRLIFSVILPGCLCTVGAKDIYVSTSFHEPATDGLRFIYSYDGVRWDSIQGVFLRPEVGKQQVMRDPSIVRGPDGTFHLVWTSSWRGDQGFGYSSSKDLIHWTPQRFIPTGMDTTTVNTWAPELFYDDVKRQFLVIWASCVPGRFPDGLEDPKNNHRLYYLTTRDFKTFSKPQLFYEPGFSAIDATLVKRTTPPALGDARKPEYDYVMVVKDNTRPMRNLKVAFASSPYGPWSAASDAFTESFTEGPSTAKVGDWWYVYYDSYRHNIYGAHRTKDFKTFQDQTGAVSFPVGHKHGTVFMAPEELVQGLIKYNRDVVYYSPALDDALRPHEAHRPYKTTPVYANPARHDGGLKPVVGIHTIQTMRGEKPWTYNHQPMMCYWNGKFYLHYLTNPRHEHEAPGKTMLQTSDDGYSWTTPVELFPEYPVPDGWTKEGHPDLPPAHHLKAVMHQRVGWYVFSRETGLSDQSGLSRKSRTSSKSRTSRTSRKSRVSRASKNSSVLLATGYYGICLTMKDDPNDGNGIGRVVRRINEDGSFGPVYFVYYNHGFSPRNTVFPYYKQSKDKAFVQAVDAMLADPMQRMQWVEETDRNDPLIPLQKPYKAFCGYTLPDGRKVGLWKHALTSLSADGGNTWRQVWLPNEKKWGCDRAPGFVNSNAKIWGQRLTDGTYAIVYNPAEYRWPLAISLSRDGLEYNTLSLVNGEVTPLRHGGQYKSYGPQYVRGIQEGNGLPTPSRSASDGLPASSHLVSGGLPTPSRSASGGLPASSRPVSGGLPTPSRSASDGLPAGLTFNNATPDGDLWVNYSNNKEDIWVSRIPVPVRLDAIHHAGESFGSYNTLSALTDWNLYIPCLCPVTLDGDWLALADSAPYDYAKAERIIPNTKELQVEFDVKAGQNGFGELHIEFVDDAGTVCSRLVADSTGSFRVKSGARYGTLLKHYKPGVTYHITATLSCRLHRVVYTITEFPGSSVVSESSGTSESPDSSEASESPSFSESPASSRLSGKCIRQFDTPVESISRIIFRTGPLFDKPDTTTPADQDFDQPLADTILPQARFSLANVTSRPVYCGFPTVKKPAEAPYPSLLSYDTFAHYADRFNVMEDENIVTTIPNAQASQWMRENIPLFDCPDEQMREIYYYRWWTLRKHIKRTPVGYGMTEFLVQRSYADRYNLIACAIGHHVMESRWLRDTTYLHQILRTWYYGNDGQPMAKMNKFSSWNPAAVYEMWKVQGDTAFLFGLKPRLEEEYARWESTNRLPNGLYWQGDVQDGMEESISGGRNKRYARPTINSYMYGNAKALAAINRMIGETEKADAYEAKADTLRRLIESKLWNERDTFFETRRGDTLAAVREAIGFLPWYFNLPPVGTSYDAAWQQLLDEQGFAAPYGLTTAERRHPEFRSHGVGKCEWDGAVWPFATSQTLTALANYLQDTSCLNSSGCLSDLFFRQMQLYTESQHHRGRPYIGEYLDEKTGAWLMGDRERSRYYNHSTFNDLIITGIAGLRPQDDGSIVVNPLVPHDKWDYFCLDGISYRGHVLTIVWDRDGQRYHQSTGLTLMVDGLPVANRKELGRLSTTIFTDHTN